MTVQRLIDVLNQVENKDIEIRVQKNPYEQLDIRHIAFIPASEDGPEEIMIVPKL